MAQTVSAQQRLATELPTDLLVESDSEQRLGSQYVPDDAIGAVVLSPGQWWDNPMLSMMPVEVLRVQGRETFGLDPLDISEIRASLSLSPQTGQPVFAVVVTTTGEVNEELLLSALNAAPDPIDINGRSMHPINGPAPMVFGELDATASGEQIWYLGMVECMDEVTKAESGSGALPSRMNQLPARTGISLVVEMQSIRPMVSGLAMSQAGQMAPGLQPLAQIPGLTDAVLLNIDFSESSGKFELTVVGTDEAAAERIELILERSMIEARGLIMEEVQRNLDTSDSSPAMREAVQAYANRMADMILSVAKPMRVGTDITIQTESEIGIATTGVLVGLLLPAVQAARTAARRMSSSNNMKQIMLAFHNYHAAYGQLPPSAITNDDGEPLLSWRVALLPFMEEQELYQQFRLDEPWDSEHNLPLSKKLPATYECPGAVTEPGHTIMQAIVGEDIGMRPLKRTGWRDFLDGLSNSVLIVETNADQAVIWSKPDDIEIDLNDPLNGLGSSFPGGFHVGMGDGAIKFITTNVDPNLFRKLLTRAGREVVDF